VHLSLSPPFGFYISFFICALSIFTLKVLRYISIIEDVYKLFNFFLLEVAIKAKDMIMVTVPALHGNRNMTVSKKKPKKKN